MEPRLSWGTRLFEQEIQVQNTSAARLGQGPLSIRHPVGVPFVGVRMLTALLFLGVSTRAPDFRKLPFEYRN